MPSPSPKPIPKPSASPKPTVAAAGAAAAAAPAPSPVPSPPASPEPQPTPAPTTGRLIVRTAPWCELSVDGRVIGRTPQTLTLPVGPHDLICKNPSGASLERRIELRGDRDLVVEERIAAAAMLRPHLVRGDAIAVDEGPASAEPRAIQPGRRRLSLSQAGAVIDSRWIDIPTSGCRLIDTPVLRCEDP